MDRAIDNTVLLALGIPVALLAPAGPASVASLLAAICAACTVELARRRPTRLIAAGGLLAAAAVMPPLAAFAALAAYAAWAFRLGALRWAWPLPLVCNAVAGSLALAAAAAALGLLACLMGWRARRNAEERERLRSLRDTVQEERLALAERARDLAERQDLEVSCAVLGERARIAREIHDNVGHLLTRSVLQVQAVSVAHGADTPVARDLDAVAETLHEALDTVRASVHDLHDAALDARTALETLVAEFPGLDGSLSFQAGALPRPVGLAVIAIVREALSNASSHGLARHATVLVTEFPSFYQLIVEDDGRAGCAEAAPGSAGARAAVPPATAGLGLTSMAERAEALGGTFSFAPLAAPRTGSRVFATFPKPQEDA
ncbi:sensor histidine kinase [uncultured Adlercreutzia sp.]|uniref:sensor histidine kinase n=1 Tax=uncultured Adlercreutzia sp. TaxID=875803 RepID=UPI0026745E9B|nr:histidine kinase [uncultured Adlercreutzia sp.]